MMEGATASWHDPHAPAQSLARRAVRIGAVGVVIVGLSGCWLGAEPPRPTARNARSLDAEGGFILNERLDLEGLLGGYLVHLRLSGRVIETNLVPGAFACKYAWVRRVTTQESVFE